MNEYEYSEFGIFNFESELYQLFTSAFISYACNKSYILSISHCLP